jgi:predicted ATPase/DNA-binding SARP family transcriptional activator
MIALGDTAVGGIKTAKALALLAYLATESDRPHRREALAGLLWPDSSEKAARSSLRQAVATLRKVLGATVNPPIFLSSRESLQLNPGADFDLDVENFTKHITFTQTHRHRCLDTCKICINRLKQAVALYRGEFLAGLSLPDAPQFESWLVHRRESLHRQALAALAILADSSLRQADYERAFHLAQRQLELEPWREAAHRQAMAALAYSGQRSAALAQFEQARETLSTELDLEPEDETAELYFRICDNALGPAPADRRISGTIPRPATPLIGRETELEELSRRIADPDSRLITLAGPGGSGKTRLAQAVALAMEADFPHGAAFVSLVAANYPADILAAITDTIGLRLQAVVPEEEQLLSFLEAKEMLLVLDNYEQLLPETGFLQRLLQQAPGIVPLVTSRHRLGLSAEWLYDVGGLHVPSSAPASELTSYSGIQLFVQRARQVHHRFRLTPKNEEAIAFICRLTGGLPLAIELSAALVRYQSPKDIASELQKGLDLLRSRHADLDPRHRSMTAAFEHSWHLLSDEEKQVFRRLAVFREGFTVDLAVEVTGTTQQTLSQLVDKSLVARQGERRFELHELLRQFASAKLVESSEEIDIRRRHLQTFLKFAQKGEEALYGSPKQLEWLSYLEDEHANMRAAIEWGLHHDLPNAAALASANWLYYFIHGHIFEAIRTYDALLDQQDQLLDASLAWVLNSRCAVALAQGDLARLKAYAEQALECFQRLEDNFGIGLSYHHLAHVSVSRGDFDRGSQLVSMGLEAAGNNLWLKGIVLQHKAHLFELQGNLNQAAQTNLQRLEIREQINDLWTALYARSDLAKIEIKRKNLARAYDLLLRTKVEAENCQEMQVAAWVQELLGLVALASGEPEQAVAHVQQAIDIQDNIGSGQERPVTLLELGVAQTESKRFHRARQSLFLGSQLALKDHLAPVTIALLEHLVRLDWLERRDPACVRNLSATAHKRLELQMPLEFPYDIFVNQTLEEIRQEINADEFIELWQDGRTLEPAQLLQELLLREQELRE